MSAGAGANFKTVPESAPQFKSQSLAWQVQAQEDYMMLTTQEKTKERLEKLALNISQPTTNHLYQKRLRIKH